MEKTLRKIVAGAIVVAAGAGIIYSNNYNAVTSIENIPYRGYRHENVGDLNFLVFDKDPLKSRKGAPEVRAIGNPKGLFIGKKYDIKVKHPNIIGDDRIISINPSN